MGGTGYHDVCIVALRVGFNPSCTLLPKWKMLFPPLHPFLIFTISLLPPRLQSLGPCCAMFWRKCQINEIDSQTTKHISYQRATFRLTNMKTKGGRRKKVIENEADESDGAKDQ